MDPVKQAYAWLDQKVEEEFQQWAPRSPRFNPSGIYKCSRQLCYEQMGTQPEFTEGGGFLTQYGPYGDFAHDQVRGVLRDAGCELAGLNFMGDGRVVETDIIKKTFEHNGEQVTISGRGDGRIKLGDFWAYLELKSVDAYKYRWMQDAYQKGKIVEYLTEKYSSYILQSNMMCSPEMLDLPGTYLVIVNRSNCQFGFSDKDHTNREGGVYLPFDHELWEKQKNKMAFIEKSRRTGVLPVQEEAEGSVACSRCPFEKRCWGGA